MNYSGNMPDWHQYNSTQPIGSEVPPVGQNANHSPIFGPNISPRRLNGPTYSPEGLNKPQNEGNYNSRNFPQSPNTLNGPNVPPENSPMGSTPQMSGCHGPYGTPSPRNTMIEGTGASLESRNLSSSSLHEAITQRNHQISMNRPAPSHLNCPTTINGSMGPMGQRNTPPSIQGPIPTSNRQGPGSYIPCKLPCCNPDTNIGYQSWEKFGPYPPNVPYRDTGYPVDNRRFGNEFENREQLVTGTYNMDSRRNFPEYKYRKESIIPRPYAPPPGVIQNYPNIQNYNFPADYQKYPAYPIKEYPRDNSSIPNPQNPPVLKYQEQSVIVQQKYFTKQGQYQNGAIPKNIVPTTMGSNVISRGQNPYFNPQLPRDFPRNYSDSALQLANRGIQTPNPIHAAYPKYQMYQQKIAMQRFSMENNLQELSRIPGYQSHPKYQESLLRYRELVRLQQTVDYQSTVQDSPKVVTSHINEEIPPINLQFDQNGLLINTSFVRPAYSNLQSPINLQNSKNVQNLSNTEVGPLNLQHPEQFKAHTGIDNRAQDRDSSSTSQIEQSHKNEQQYCIEKDQSRLQKYESVNLCIPNSDDGKTPSISQRNSKDFADKPELDVRQFLANWDESEDEDGANANLPDVVLSNSAASVVEYENPKAVLEKPEESANCSESEDCRGRDDCGLFENMQNETKASSSTHNQIYQCNLPPGGGESTKSIEKDLGTSDSERRPVRTGSVIQPTSIECESDVTLRLMENLANGRAVHDNVKLLCRETESLNNNAGQESTDKVEGDIVIKKESSIEEQQIKSIEEHNKTHNHKSDTEICSSIEEIIKNDGKSRSSSESESSDDTKHHSDSDDDSSESDDSNSMDNHSNSSFIKSPKTIKGTEIHVDAQELSTIPTPAKNNSAEILDSMNLQKQSSFVSEESHNPDDISLPDLPTSEYTPISTALNTPIHSDSEESSEPIIDLTTPANPIEIIQNSPMLSFTHSPIKMEPYEHLDENDLTDKMSRDTLDFEFQASNSCDNDYDRSTDMSSHTTEQYNIGQNDEDTFDSDCVEILSEKAEEKIESNICNVETKDHVTDNIIDQNRFSFNKAIVMTTDEANTTVNAYDQPWPLVTVREDNHQVSINTEHQNADSDVDKLETLSEMKDRLSIMSEVTKDSLKDDMVHIPSAKNHQSTNRWETKCEVENVQLESTDNMTALNLVKDENKIKSDSIKTNDGPANSEVIPKASKSCPSDSNDGENSKHLKQSECNSSMENEAIFKSTENTVRYASTSEEHKIYTETLESQTNFPGSLNIPLIPGEDFEEPKMPVLPMEGNCLTKIIKNTSPITDLDVLGSDDEKLDKMDDIWMEVGGVEAVGKVPNVNTDTYTGGAESSGREKSSCSGKKIRMLQKRDWKYLKNSIKPKDPSKLSGKVFNDNLEIDSKNTNENTSPLQESSSSEKAPRESESMNKNFQSEIISDTDNTAAALLEEKHNFNKVPTTSRISRDNFSCADGKQSQIMYSDNNVTEILKCREKVNHINDIATKLLENARLSEPEVKKIELQKKESSCGDSTRDGSKKRIKLLKEFRKVKNKTNIDGPGMNSEQFVDVAENHKVPSIEITKQCKKIGAQIMEVDNEIVKYENTSSGGIENVLQKSDSLITNSIDTTDCQVIQKANVNAEEDNSRAVSADIPMPNEEMKQISNDGKSSLRNEDTSRDSFSTVNTKDDITVKDRNNFNDYDNSDPEVVSPIKEDINECAINLSKSSNDFGLLNILSEEGCAKNDSPNSYTSENTKIEEPTEIETKPHEETTCAEIVEENNKTLEQNHGEHENVTESNREGITISTCTNSAEECISEGDTKLEEGRESTRAVDHEKPEEFPISPENVKDLEKSYRHPEEKLENIYENSKTSVDGFGMNGVEMDTLVSEPSEHPESTGLVAIDKKEDQHTNKTTDPEVMHDAESRLNNVGETSTGDKQNSIELTESLDGSEKMSPSSPEEDKSIEIVENSSQNTSDFSKEKVDEFVETYIETKSIPQRESNIGELSIEQQMTECEPKVDDDCSRNIQEPVPNSDVTTDIYTESKTIYKDLEIVEKPSSVNESLIDLRLEESTRTKCLQSTNVEVPSETDNNFSTVDATFEAFGLENSFNDFNNFDVAPNLTDPADTDVSNDWKYSRAHARFEDCERYKNPDNFVDPILPSLETLDNLNTVPVYTTKDGKITYSPNPKFTYRTLIMEARKREGYPTSRESYSANPRTQESLQYSRNQASFRKRKNSDTYSSSRSYGKKNYSEYYEPREHGESSMKNSSEPWSRSYSSYNKYSHQSKDRNSHHSTPHNKDAENKHTAGQIAQGKVSSRYKHREESAVFDEHNKRKNGTSDSLTRKHYKQSTEQSTSNSAGSGSRRNLEHSSDAALSRSEKIETSNIRNNKSLERNINIEKPANISKNSHRWKDFKQTEKLTAASDENEHTTESTTNILSAKAALSISSEILAGEKQYPDSRVEEFESSSSKTVDKFPNNQNLLEISNHGANEISRIRPGVFLSEWEDSCEILTVQQPSSREMKAPPEALLDEVKEVYNEKTKVNELYDGVDDVCPSKSSDINEKTSDETELLDNKCVTPLNSIISPIRNESFEECDPNEEKLNTDTDKSTTNNADNEDTSHSMPVQPIQTDEYGGGQRIPEISETPNEPELAADLNKEIKENREEVKFDGTLHSIHDQISSNCSSEVKRDENEDLIKDEIRINEQKGYADLNEIIEVHDNLVAVSIKSNEEVMKGPEDLRSMEKTEEIERKELKIKSSKIKPENKNGTSVKNVQQTSNDSSSFRMRSEFDQTSKPQAQCENYIAYSPSNEGPEDTKAIPKLVIKKTDSLNNKNVGLATSSATSRDGFSDKVSDKEEHGSKVSVQPKIPKILIRNAKSRPSTPSIEEITEEKIFSVTTKDESKVPKIKIRFEEKRPRSPIALFNENVTRTDATENKIPKMKIKLEDKLSKVIIKNINTESCVSNEEVPKTIPKMKIKKFKGPLGQIVDTQILPVSIPRLFIYTELESEQETTTQNLSKKEVGTSDKNLKSATRDSIEKDIKTDSDLKKIPKLKIKRQSSGCSIELNRKRHSISPVQSELKKVRKSSKVVDPNEKRQLTVGTERYDSSNKLDTFSVEQSYELASSENVGFTIAALSSESVKEEPTKSIGGNISVTPEEIPKVIIKRASPSAEFKCELSEVRRDAIIKNKRWQPEVKLHRSWVLDCMAKDLNLDNLTLKLATPGSILNKRLSQKRTELEGTCGRNRNANTNQNEKKLFRSKSTSELEPPSRNFELLTKDDIKQLSETDATDLSKEFIIPKRCKSDLGSTFSRYSENSECKKKLKRHSHSSTIQSKSKPALNYANEFGKSSTTQYRGESDMLIEKNHSLEDSKTNFNINEIQSNNEVVHCVETSERKIQDQTLSETEISTSKINSSISNNEPLETSLADSNLNSKIIRGSTNTNNISEDRCERFENSNEITNNLMNDLKMNKTSEVNDNFSNNSATKCKKRTEGSKDSVIVKNTNVDSVKRNTKSGKKHAKEIRNRVTKKEKIADYRNDDIKSIKNMSTNYILEELTRTFSSTSIASHDRIDHAKTVIDDIVEPIKSVILEAPTLGKSDANILEGNSEICSSDTINTLNNLETTKGKNIIQKLDINDNSDGNVGEAEDNNTVSENSTSYINIVEEVDIPSVDEQVLITTVSNESESIDSVAENLQDTEIDINQKSGLDNVSYSEGNSVKKVKPCEDSQRIIDILSDSPSRIQDEVEFQLCPDIIEETDMCLYHEDAIPTQFELELEIVDNVVPDPLEVPLPKDDQTNEESQNHSGAEADEGSHRSSRILSNLEDNVNFDDPKIESILSEDNNSQVCSISVYEREFLPYRDERGATLSANIGERNSRFDSNVKKSSSFSDLLVKEVLAAKETLRKCLGRSKYERRFKVKARTKTAAEKKQGSSFDLNISESSESSFSKLENHSINNFVAGGNSSRQMDGDFSSTNNDNTFIQNHTKTEFKINKIKSERKHSKGSRKSNLVQKKYSSLPESIEKYTNRMQVDGYLIPKNSSIDIKDKVEFSKGETTISLKNSKHLIKNNSNPEEGKKKMSELINSKDTKSRSKSSRHDVHHSKYIGKSKNSLPNTAVQETSLEALSQSVSEEKSVSDAAKNKYKLLKTPLDQNINSMTDKAKFKLYKIPKIPKATNSESDSRLIEELRQSHSKEARMPILEPQVDLNGSLKLSDSSSDRETSRSPPVITTQENRVDYEVTTTQSLVECQATSNAEKDVLSEQRTTFLEKKLPEAVPISYGKETTVADIVNDMAYHEKATIRHRRYCTLCERWFPTVTRYKRHLSGYQHRHTELTQRRTIHALFTLFTGRPCPRLQPPGIVRVDCEPGELTPLQIAVQGVTKESNKVDGNIKKPTREDK